MSKDTQIRSGSCWQCRMSISQHFQLRYLILKFFRSEARLVPGTIRLSPRSPHPHPLSSQGPRDRSDGRRAEEGRCETLACPGRCSALHHPLPRRHPLRKVLAAVSTTLVCAILQIRNANNGEQGLFSSRFPVRP